MRACNTQPSEPFIYWGLKSYRSTFNDISLCKKKALTLKKKHKKHSSPSKKASHRKKAQKSTHYDPWNMEQVTVEQHELKLNFHRSKRQDVFSFLYGRTKPCKLYISNKHSHISQQCGQHNIRASSVC